MRVERKNAVRNSVARLIVSVLGFSFQTLWFVALFYRFNSYSENMELITKAVALVLVLRLFINDDLNTNMKLLWILIIATVPFFGITLYVMYGRHGSVGMARKRHHIIKKELAKVIVDDSSIIKELEDCDMGVANQFRYASKDGAFPVFKCQKINYFKEPNEGLKRQIKEISRAKEFVFIEYHAIEDSVAFWSMLVELKKAVARGVEVRIIYDDVGSIGFLTTSFIRKMKSYGIECRVFNRVLPVLNIFMQNRDHRKIVVVDGKVAFTGGYNLADEYFGITKPYGEWKDTGACIEGEAVLSLTKMFLYMWNIIKYTDTDEKIYGYIEKSLCPKQLVNSGEGYILPYGGNPLSKERLTENIYLNMIKNSKRYIYITTPYLIISNEMQKELVLAAKRGVDVRIVTPGIPDKKMIYQATKSYYPSLVKNGVKVFEYTPGFCHAKQFLCDDECAIIGTINLDFRSLYHHFENALLLYKVSIINEMKSDFDEMFEVSKNVTVEYSESKFILIRAWRAAMRLFSPLL